MSIFDTFAKRQKKLRGEVADVYIYDELPEPLRVQIIQIMHDILGENSDYNYSDSANRIQECYGFIVKILRKELGVFILPNTSTRNNSSYILEITEYILNEKDIEHLLSAIEIICRAITKISSTYEYRYIRDANDNARDAILEINERFKEHGIGYEYDEEIIRIDTEFIHSEAVKPAINLLRNYKYSGAEQEFLSAYNHYRKGKYKESLNDALKSFESTMKSIYDKRKWAYTKTDPASRLIKVAFDNGLIPTFWESHFSALRTTLEAGVPTARNKLSGHGQGSTPTDIPPHLVTYVLHLTASAIVFLVKSDEALP